MRAIVRHPRREKVPQIDAHDRERYDPDPHQVAAFNHIVENKRAGLFLGMSLGKTAIITSALEFLTHQDFAITKTLVIAPKKVAGIAWTDELDKWEHTKDLRYSIVAGTPEQRLAALKVDADIYLLGVDSLVWLEELYKRKKTSRGLPMFDCIVIDESSLFKSPSSQRFLALKRLAKRLAVDYRYILTGTPAPNGYIDLWAQIFFLDDGERLGTTFGEYVREFFTARGKGTIVYEYIPRANAQRIIARRLQDIVLSMETRDYLPDLPDLIETDHVLEFDEFDRELYDTLERDFVLEWFKKEEEKRDEGEVYITVKSAANLSGKLLQLSSGAIYDDDKIVRELNTLKIDALGDILEEREDNVIVAYFFKHELDRIKKKYPHARELKTRQDVREWNEGRIKLLLMHPASAGHGLNLQFGGYCLIFTTPTWNLEHYSQTVARLLRRAQKHAVEVIRLIVKGTRDKEVVKSIARKDNAQKFFMSEVKRLRKKYIKV